MASTNLIGIIGIILTILFGIPAVYILIKNRYPGQITLIKETSLALFDSLVKSFPEFSIHYKNNAINEGLVFLKGAILNTGKIDLDETMISKKLTIDLPKDYKWISAKIIAASPDLQATVAIINNKIEFTTSLFRCREFFRFEALAEIPIVDIKKDKKRLSLEEKLEKGMCISHRISNTQSVIKVRDLPSLSKESRRLKLLILPVIMDIILIILLSMVLLKGYPAKTNFIIKDAYNNDTRVKVTTMRHGKITIKGIDKKDFKKTMLTSEFISQPNLKISIECDDDVKVIIFAILLQTIFLFAAIGFTYKEYNEGRKLRKLLDINS